MKGRKSALLIIVLGLFLTIQAIPVSTFAADKPVIKFADGGWDSVQVESRIAAFIMEKAYGYPTELIFVDVSTIKPALAKGVWIYGLKSGF